MKNSGIQWQCYDVMYRQKRGKRIARGSKKVSGWATLDVVLYLECQAAKLQGRPEGPTQRPSLGLTPSQAPTHRPYVSVQSDERAHQLSMASPYTQIHAGGSRGWGVKGTVPGHKHTGVIHAGQGTPPRTAHSIWPGPTHSSSKPPSPFNCQMGVSPNAQRGQET